MTARSLGQPQPVDADWRDVQAQIDAVVHEHDGPARPREPGDAPPAPAGDGASDARPVS